MDNLSMVHHVAYGLKSLTVKMEVSLCATKFLILVSMLRLKLKSKEKNYQCLIQRSKVWIPLFFLIEF